MTEIKCTCGHLEADHVIATGSISRICVNCVCKQYTPIQVNSKILPHVNIKTEIVLTDDKVKHPSHYTAHPSGVECYQITQWMTANVAQAMKYQWRAGLKKDPDKSQRAKHIEDLKKAQQFLQFEVERLEGIND